MRIGIDLGGTKIEGVVMDASAQILARERVATPAGDYAGTVQAIVALVQRLEQAVQLGDLPVGIGTPGAPAPSGLMHNCNSTCLNGQPLLADLEARLGARVRMANDADCLALSEAADGAAAGAGIVFGVILGTGVGGGIVVHGQLLQGANGIAGEWGHNPLPWLQPDELPGRACYCGQQGCIETWLSGPGLAADHQQHSGQHLSGEQIVAAAQAGEAQAEASLQRYEQRLARALASVINLIDPQVLVLGGGLSRLERLYRNVPRLLPQWVFSTAALRTQLLPARHGDASGVRGAAFLWPVP